jgi:hypothetical protein
MEVRRVQAEEGPAHSAIERGGARELPQLLALGAGAKRTRPRPTNAKAVGPRSSGVEKSVPSSIRSSKSSRRSETPRARKARGASERCTRPSREPASCRPTSTQRPARRSNTSRQYATQARGSSAANTCTSALNRVAPRGGLGGTRKERPSRRTNARGRSLPRPPSARERESQGEPGGPRRGRPGGLSGRGRWRVGVVGGRTQAAGAAEGAEQQCSPDRAFAAAGEQAHGGRPGGDPQVDHRPRSRSTAGPL